MANQLYPLYKEALLNDDANIDVVTTNTRLVLVSSTYVFNAAHNFRDDLSGALATPASSLANTTLLASGALDFDDFVIAGADITTGTVAAVIFYVSTGAAATDRLVAFFDTLAGLPLAVTNGTDVTFIPSAAGLFIL